MNLQFSRNPMSVCSLLALLQYGWKPYSRSLLLGFGCVLLACSWELTTKLNEKVAVLGGAGENLASHVLSYIFSTPCNI